MNTEVDVWAEASLRALETQGDEIDATLTLAEGTLPDALRGTLFRNGPGRFERGDTAYGHLFDGDGMVTRFHFTGQTVHYRNRYVRTPWFEAEAKANRVLFRSFGTNVPGGVLRNALRLKFKNAANTSVRWHAGQLLALWEAGLPFALDLLSLETVGPHDFAGALRQKGPTAWLTGSALPFSAHPRLDPATGELCNFGMRMRPPTGGDLLLYDIDSRGRAMRATHVALPDVRFVHDFVLTPRYRVFVLSSTAVDTTAMLMGTSTIADAMTFTPKPSTLVLVPRDGSTPIRFDTEPGYVFHFSNAFDDGEWVVIDGFAYDRYPRLPGPKERVHALDWSGGPHFTRWRVSPGQRTVERRTASAHVGELPMVNPLRWTQPHRWTWSSGTATDRPGDRFTHVVKFDGETMHSTSRDLRQLTGEPIIVPKPNARGEDDAWLMVLAYDPLRHRSDLHVLEASDLRTVARLELPHHVPPGFHGTFVNETRH